MVPSRIERRNVELFDIPRPMLPSGMTPTFVPTEASASAIDA
jgi:hypothetical protein